MSDSGRRRVNPPELARSSGFSHAVVAGGMVYLAGQTALDAEGGLVGVGDIAAQFERALDDLLSALRAAGGGPADLVTMTVYIVDMDAYRAAARQIGASWQRLVGRDYPAMAGIGVARLWDADALVELQATAVPPGS